MKNSTVCSARLSNQYQTLDDVNCKSKKDYYFDKINLFGSKKTENVIY